MSRKPFAFELTHKNKKMEITEVHLPAGVHYFIPSDDGLPFFITKDKDSKKWISAPPSHEKAAQEIGALIDEYYKQNPKN